MLPMKKFGSAAIVAAAWLLGVGATGEAPLTAADRQTVVEQLGQTLEANYVFADKAKTLAATLRAHLDKGDYDGAQNKDALAIHLANLSR